MALHHPINDKVRLRGNAVAVGREQRIDVVVAEPSAPEPPGGCATKSSVVRLPLAKKTRAASLMQLTSTLAVAPAWSAAIDQLFAGGGSELGYPSVA